MSEEKITLKDIDNIPDEKLNALQRISKHPIYITVIMIALMIIFFTFKSMLSTKTVKQTKQVEQINLSINEQTLPEDINNKTINRQIEPEMDPIEQDKNEIKQSVDSNESQFKKDKIVATYKTRTQIYILEQEQLIQEQKLANEAQISSIVVKVEQPPSFQEKVNINQNSFPMTENISATNPDLNKYKTSENDINQQQRKLDFITSENNNSNYLQYLKENPVSQYEIKAGSVISASLITAINSDLPSNIIAQVTENVFDTVTGNYLLIPQGSRLIGTYDSQVTYGQNRTLVIWNRLIFPDGASLNLDKMQGIDVSGQAGFSDKVDNHYFKVYANALLMSLVGAGYELLNPEASTNDSESTIAGKVGQQMADVFTQQTQKNIEVQPTISIRSGYKFKVMVMKDMVLEELI